MCIQENITNNTNVKLKLMFLCEQKVVLQVLDITIAYINLRRII